MPPPPIAIVVKRSNGGEVGCGSPNGNCTGSVAGAAVWAPGVVVDDATVVLGVPTVVVGGGGGIVVVGDTVRGAVFPADRLIGVAGVCGSGRVVVLEVDVVDVTEEVVVVRTVVVAGVVVVAGTVVVLAAVVVGGGGVITSHHLNEPTPVSFAFGAKGPGSDRVTTWRSVPVQFDTTSASARARASFTSTGGKGASPSGALAALPSVTT